MMDEEINKAKGKIMEVDEGCRRVEKALEGLGPELRFNVLVNMLTDMVTSTNNPALILGMMMLGISHAVVEKTGLVHDIDKEEHDNDDREPKSTH